jgi:spore coat polysaccharide biosynthesis protein SpsF
MTGCRTFHSSIFDFESQESYDLTWTKGVLIHINPERLIEVYEKLYSYSKRYIFIAEY